MSVTCFMTSTTILNVSKFARNSILVKKYLIIIIIINYIIYKNILKRNLNFILHILKTNSDKAQLY